MELKHIKTEKCPDCGSIVVQETQVNKHTNGEWNERRSFECGCVVIYSPNFGKEMQEEECPHSKNNMEKKEKRQIAREKLYKYISRLDVDEDFKYKLTCELNYYKYQ